MASALPALRFRQKRPTVLLLGFGLFLGVWAIEEDEQSKILRKECFLVGGPTFSYRPANFFDHILGWVAVGVPRDVTGSVLQVFSEGVSFQLAKRPDEMPLECRCALVALTITSQILQPKEENSPWGVFLRTPWEDLAKSRWPVFELLRAWAVDKAALRTTTVDANGYFWRSCQNSASFQLWQRPNIALIGDVLFAGAGLFNTTSSPGVRRALAQAAAVALLEVVDLSAMEQHYGLCSSLPIPLLALSLSLGQPRALLQPGYGLRLMQAALQWSQQADFQHFYHDLEAAPWPILALVAQVAYEARIRHRSLGTKQVGASEVQEKEREQASHSEKVGAAARHFVDAGPERTQQLLDALRVAHGLCDVMDIEYVAICGTLLGSLRHRGPIPWDDDADLCVNGLLEPRLFALVVAEEVARLNVHGDVPLPEFPSRTERAHQFLQREGHVIELVTARSLTFRIVRAGPDGRSDPAAPYVDLWMCWDLAHVESQGTLDQEEQASGFDGVVLMSRRYGPRIPRSVFYPRRKIPFGNLAIWAPNDPMEVTRLYFVHGGQHEDFMNVCEKPKAHGGVETIEYSVSVPCKELGNFAGPWQPPDPGPEVEAVLSGVRLLMRQQLHGLAAASVDEPALTVQVSTLGSSAPDRWRVEGWLSPARGERVLCEALLWRGESPKDDWLEPGWLVGSGQVVRSFLCRPGPSEEPTYVWERKTLGVIVQRT